MKIRESFPVAAAVAFFISASGAHAAPACDIAAEKKQIITTLLCGQDSPDVSYRFYGPNCVIKSAAIRMDDSVIQVLGYRLCGDETFAARLLESNKKAIQFMKTLSACVPEIVDVDRIANESMVKISAKFASQICNQSMRDLLENRRPYFEQQIVQSEVSDQSKLIYDKFHIRVDGDGNVFDK